MRTFTIKFITAIAFLVAAAPVARSQSLEPAEAKRIVESKNYIFKAERVTPSLGSRLLQLTGEYDLVVSGDSIVAFLPYFGRAYTAPINPSEGGIKFTSTQSSYVIKKKKNSWDITIKPSDVQEIQQLFLDIFNNGRASLRIISTNRESISFEGYIVEGKEKPKKAF